MTDYSSNQCWSYHASGANAIIACQEANVALSDFINKQFIKVIQWNEGAEGALSYRYPMQDMEIENGGQLTVRESQLALFVNEGRIADVFAPGMHTLIDAQPADPDRSDELEQGL